MIPADLPAAMVADVQRLSIEAFRAIDAAGLARVDFLLARDTGEIYLNEINTMPGFTTISMYSKMWEASASGLQRARRSADPTRHRAASRKTAPQDQRALSGDDGSAQGAEVPGCLALISAVAFWLRTWRTRDRHPRRPGITAAPTIARAYDLILDANFDELKKTLPATCPPAPIVACRGLEALSLWWQIQLDPESPQPGRRIPGRREQGNRRSGTMDRG